MSGLFEQFYSNYQGLRLKAKQATGEIAAAGQQQAATHATAPEMSPEMEKAVKARVTEEMVKQTKEDIGLLQAFRRARYNPSLDKFFAKKTSVTAADLEGNLLVKGHVRDRRDFLIDLEGRIQSENISFYLNAAQEVWEKDTGVSATRDVSRYAPQIRELYAALEGRYLSDLEISDRMESSDKSLEAIALDADLMEQIHPVITRRRNQLTEMYDNFNNAKTGIVGKAKEFNWWGHSLVAGGIFGLIVHPILKLATGINNPENYAKLAGASGKVAVTADDLANKRFSAATAMKKSKAGWLSRFTRWCRGDAFLSRMANMEGGMENAHKKYHKIRRRLLGAGKKLSGIEYLADGKGWKIAGKEITDVNAAITRHYRHTNRLSQVGLRRWLWGHSRGLAKGALRIALGMSSVGWLLPVGIAAAAGLYLWSQEEGGAMMAGRNTIEKTRHWGQKNLPIDLLPNYGVWAA